MKFYEKAWIRGCKGGGHPARWGVSGKTTFFNFTYLAVFL